MVGIADRVVAVVHGDHAAFAVVARITCDAGGCPKAISLGLDKDLKYHALTGAITHLEAGWQNADLTSVPWPQFKAASAPSSHLLCRPLPTLAPFDSMYRTLIPIEPIQGLRIGNTIK